jgi:hypothetical protein
LPNKGNRATNVCMETYSDPTDHVDSDPPEAYPRKAEQLLAAAIQMTSGCSEWSAGKEAAELVDALGRMGPRAICEALACTEHQTDPLPEKANTRNAGPETSRAAAATIDDLSDRHWAVWACLSERPSTDSELLARYHQREALHAWPKQTPQSIRSRRAELVQAGHVEHSGIYGLSDTGRSAIIWRTVG